MVSPALELIDSISLSAEGLLQTERLLAAVVSAPADARAVLSSAFFWLLRAWPERDRVSKFVALFIPLEIILAEYTAGPQTELRQQGRAIRKLIRQHGGSECDSLMVFFNGQAIPEPNPRGGPTVDDSFLVIFNGHHEPIKFTLPGKAYGRMWNVVVDTASDGPVTDKALKPRSKLAAQARSVIVLQCPREAAE